MTHLNNKPMDDKTKKKRKEIRKSDLIIHEETVDYLQMCTDIAQQTAEILAPRQKQTLEDIKKTVNEFLQEKVCKQRAIDNNLMMWHGVSLSIVGAYILQVLQYIIFLIYINGYK